VAAASAFSPTARKRKPKGVLKKMTCESGIAINAKRKIGSSKMIGTSIPAIRSELDALPNKTRRKNFVIPTAKMFSAMPDTI